MSVSKIVAAAASSAGGASLDVDEVFSTYLWAGNSTNSRNIVNGIDVSGEGGLVWIKDRTVGDGNSLFTTDRGANKTLLTNATDAEDTVGTSVFESFNSNGFTVGSHGRTNENNRDYVSWTFRKAPKFFDVVTYTGNSTEGRTISHNLGSVPGMMIVKRTSSAQNWAVYHRGNTAAPETDVLYLNSTDATTDLGSAWYDTAPTSTEFTLGDQIGVNANGETYVAYLFAHNNNDGEFGPDGDQDIIKCGSFTSDSSGIATVNLGFEPQWVLFKGTHAGSSWFIVDVMRGMVNGANDAWLAANLTNAEGTSNTVITPTPTGFVTDGTNIVDPSQTFIFMAIRTGPLAVPDDATKVFAIDTQGSTGDGAAPAFRSTFPIDAIYKKSTAGGGTTFASRLTGTNFLRPESTNAESSNSQNLFDFMNGGLNNTATYAPNYGYMWKRAPGFFDVVAYDGGTTNISHGLGVNPEMIWVKRRDGTSHWAIYHKDTGLTKTLQFDTNAPFTNTTFTAIFDDAFRGQTSYTSINYNNYKYVAYLFATAPGVSFVGSVTHSGSSTDVDCGFSSGARFVLLKRTDASGDWLIWDATRGIVSGNDPSLALNSTAAEVTNTDYIDPLSSGFQITGDFTDGTYIFYAIA